MRDISIYLRNVFLIFIVIQFWYSCQKECHDFSSSSETCDYTNLIVCDSSLDVYNYVVRNDSTYPFGTARAIKSIKSKGEIAWTANNSAEWLPDGSLYLNLENYADTSWLGLQSWAYLRENIGIKLEPFQDGIQKIFSRDEYEGDSLVNFANYVKFKDDVADARWKIDPLYESTLLVTAIDTISQIIEGEFDLRFILTSQSTLSGVKYEPRARFKCGIFRAKIYQ